MIKNITLLKHQRPMLKTIAKIIVGSLKKDKKEIKEIKKKSKEFTVTPPVQVVESFHKWLDASAKYQDSVAPHLYPQWAIPELFSLGEDLDLPFHKILNQGCKLIVNSPIPKGQNLMGKVQVLDIVEHETKYRINQKVWTGPKENPAAIEADIYAVMLKDNKSSFSDKKEHKALDLKSYKNLGSIFISKTDAKNYGLISGDINPIHMNAPMAKIFGLKSSLMHGFGVFSLVFEELERNGFYIHELEMKFLRPIYLNSTVNIYINKSNDHYLLKVVNESEDMIHLSGHFNLKA